MVAIQKLGNEAVRLSDLERNEFTEPINVDRLKQHFARKREDEAVTRGIGRRPNPTG